ncbi:alpha/beta hydrolase fold protein [Pirellula staleyi DSM 6068]|uniref:Alpha/beta hydrolase fold protein n=1 Tax=Pirellula staleyi (strain ATCC 27377 / DSM 6068 / ICPB 4128) TaxID=530564 RepID=D2R463_PIRSD|nr:alpha/beta fold hydrolase [Pirellula staleyi]ADB18912.1 alpha/beta hydrolase fold protein [Pirellula staleyi DSM 6068]
MAESWRSLYPFQSHYFEREKLRYHYVDEGASPSAAKRPLLFVHGNPTWSFYWRELIAGLKADYRCIAVDHIGCGLSDKPQDYPYSLAKHTENLVALVEKLDLKNCTLLAHDWGGAIGLGCAAQLRERFSQLVLFNTAAFPPPYIPKRIQLCRVPILGTLGVRGLNLFARAAITMATEEPQRMTAAVKAGFLAPYNNWHNRVAIDAFVKDIPWTRAHPTYQVLEDLETKLAKITHLQQLLVWGMRDWCFRSECLDRLKRTFTQAEELRFDTAGHYVVQDRPAEILERLHTFLAQVKSV